MSEYEAVIDDIGGFGPAQIQVFILVSLFEAPAAWGLLVHPVFAARKLPWTCDYGDANVSHVIPSVNITNASNGNDDWWSKNCTLQESGLCSSINYTGEYTSIVSEWDLICSKTRIADLITTLQMVGGVAGAFISGQLADIFGRKKILIGVYAIFILSSFCSAFANSWIMYLILKIIVGASMSGTMVVNFALTMEFVTPRWRTFCGTVGFWNVGVMTLAFMAWLIPNWRHLTMTCAVIGLPLLACWWFIPESPRWLLLRGRRKEAEAILCQMAKRNKKPAPDFTKLQAFMEREHEMRKDSRKYSYWDLCRNFNMTKTTATVLYTWFACSCVYYGTTLGSGKLHGNTYLNLFLSGLVEIPGLIFVLVFNNRIGRRLTLCILLTLGGVCCLCVLLVNQFAPEHLWISTVLALLGKSGISGGWAAALVSSAEVFPTVIRNIGMASSSIAARIGSVAAPLMANLDEFHISLPYVIFGALGLSCGLLCLLLPETLNRPLPDSLPRRVYCTCIDSHEEDTDCKEMKVLTSAASKNVEKPIDSTRDYLLVKTNGVTIVAEHREDI